MQSWDVLLKHSVRHVFALLQQFNDSSQLLSCWGGCWKAVGMQE